MRAFENQENQAPASTTSANAPATVSTSQKGKTLQLKSAPLHFMKKPSVEMSNMPFPSHATGSAQLPPSLASAGHKSNKQPQKNTITNYFKPAAAPKMNAASILKASETWFQSMKPQLQQAPTTKLPQKDTVKPSNSSNIVAPKKMPSLVPFVDLTDHKIVHKGKDVQANELLKKDSEHLQKPLQLQQDAPPKPPAKKDLHVAYKDEMDQESWPLPELTPLEEAPSDKPLTILQLTELISIYNFIASFIDQLSLDEKYVTSFEIFEKLFVEFFQNKRQTRINFLEFVAELLYDVLSVHAPDPDMLNVQALLSQFLADRGCPSATTFEEEELTTIDIQSWIDALKTLVNALCGSERVTAAIKESIKTAQAIAADKPIQRKRRNELISELSTLAPQLRELTEQHAKAALELDTKQEEVDKQVEALKKSLDPENDEEDAITRRKRTRQITKQVSELRETFQDDLDVLETTVNSLGTHMKSLQNRQSNLTKELANLNDLLDSGGVERHIAKEMDRIRGSDGGVITLGRDRWMRLYWYMEAVGGIVVEPPSENVTEKKAPLKKWYAITDKQTLEKFVSALSMKGPRERALKKKLAPLVPELVERMDEFNEWCAKRGYFQMSSDEQKENEEEVSVDNQNDDVDQSDGVKENYQSEIVRAARYQAHLVLDNLEKLITLSNDMEFMTRFLNSNGVADFMNRLEQLRENIDEVETARQIQEIMKDALPTVLVDINFAAFFPKERLEEELPRGVCHTCVYRIHALKSETNDSDQEDNDENDSIIPKLEQWQAAFANSRSLSSIVLVMSHMNSHWTSYFKPHLQKMKALEQKEETKQRNKRRLDQVQAAKKAASGHRAARSKKNEENEVSSEQEETVGVSRRSTRSRSSNKSKPKSGRASRPRSSKHIEVIDKENFLSGEGECDSESETIPSSSSERSQHRKQTKRQCRSMFKTKESDDDSEDIQIRSRRSRRQVEVSSDEMSESE